MIWDIATEKGDIGAIYNTLGNVCNGGTPVPQNLASGKQVAVSLTPMSLTSTRSTLYSNPNPATSLLIRPFGLLLLKRLISLLHTPLMVMLQRHAGHLVIQTTNG
jgi:hypothetical protein